MFREEAAKVSDVVNKVFGNFCQDLKKINLKEKLGRQQIFCLIVICIR